MRPALRTALVLALLSSACASRTHQADDFAKRGDWEHAYEEYRAASAARPEDQDLIDKKNHAQKQLAAQWTTLGINAMAAGKLPEAGEWWRKAIELRPADQGPKTARGVVAANAQALEQFGDQAVTQKKYLDAIQAWGPLLLNSPERIDLSNKNSDAHRLYASDLEAQADVLVKKNLLGAALVADLAALKNDPMHPTAYAHSSDLRKTIVSRTAVSIPAVTMEDNGWYGLGAALVPRLNSRLGQFPPYGPTKSQTAIPAQLVVTIQDFSWADTTEHGIEAHPEKAGSGSGKVANPRYEAQKKVVAALEREAKTMEAGASLSANPSSPWITPVPAATPIATPAPAAKGAKPVAAATPAKPARKPLTARAATPDDIAKKRDELEKAKTELAAIPEQIESSQNSNYYSPWTKTTRTAHAKVRFEVRESDFTEPVFKEQEFSFEAADRASEADAAHGLASDPLKLPTIEQMIDSLADKFVDAIDVLKDARDRRAERLLDQGRQHHTQGADDEAIDSYVSAMFLLGSGGLPKDAHDLLASRGVDEKTLVTP